MKVHLAYRRENTKIGFACIRPNRYAVTEKDRSCLPTRTRQNHSSRSATAPGNSEISRPHRLTNHGGTGNGSTCIEIAQARTFG